MPPRVLTAAEGFSPGIGFYVSGMEEVRAQVRAAVINLSGEKFSRPAFLGAHSIGALVMHIGEAEWWWMQCNVAGHELTDEDRRAPYWDVLERPDAFAKRGFDAEFCLSQIDNIRAQTRKLLATFDDDDLERIFTYKRRKERHEQSLRWILHNLIDHEAHHKGQILMLKRISAA